MKKLIKTCLLFICVIGFTKTQAQTEVTFYTTKGNFVVALTDSLTPRTVDSFLVRVTKKFYDGLLFHRVVHNFVIQGGDPLGNGAGGPGYYTPDEFDPSLKNVTGSLAMANSGPNTNGSQFYFNLVNNTSLNNHYTVFGMTTSGLSVIQAIGIVATDGNDKPLVDVLTDSIRITKFRTSVPNFTNTINVSVYPNPAKGIFNIDLPNTASKVSIIDISGQVVNTITGQGKIKIDLGNQPAGLYFVSVTNPQGAYKTKIILQ